jgi:hypothetical protein
MAWPRCVRRFTPYLVVAVPVVACGGLGPSDDSTAPLVTFDVPRQGDTVSGTVIVTIAAFDDDGVVAVRIFVDGTQLTDDPSAPYQASWNAGGGANATTHTLRAEARDVSGNVGTAQVTVVVAQRAPL